MAAQARRSAGLFVEGHRPVKTMLSRQLRAGRGRASPQLKGRVTLTGEPAACRGVLVESPAACRGVLVERSVSSAYGGVLGRR